MYNTGDIALKCWTAVKLKDTQQPHNDCSAVSMRSLGSVAYSPSKIYTFERHSIRFSHAVADNSFIIRLTS